MSTVTSFTRWPLLTRQEQTSPKEGQTTTSLALTRQGRLLTSLLSEGHYYTLHSVHLTIHNSPAAAAAAAFTDMDDPAKHYLFYTILTQRRRRTP